MTISQRIEKMMKAKKISRYKLAKDTGIPYTTLTNILTNRTKDPQVSVLQIIADYFGKPLDFFTRENNSDFSVGAPFKGELDLKTILEENSSVMFNGVLIEDKDRDRLIRILEAFFWEAKEKN